MEKILYIQSKAVDLPHILIKNNSHYLSSTSSYDDIFYTFNALRSKTKCIFQGNNLTISRTFALNPTKRAYYITGNFLELDSAKRRIAFGFYIKGNNCENIVDELESTAASEGYSLCKEDKEIITKEVSNQNNISFKLLVTTLTILFLFLIINLLYFNN